MRPPHPRVCSDTMQLQKEEGASVLAERRVIAKDLQEPTDV